MTSSRNQKSAGADRATRITQLVQQELGDILLREVEVPPDARITIAHVQLSPNLQEAKVYITINPEEREQEVRTLLQKEIYDIQQLLNKRLDMRPVPKIIWKTDRVTKEAGRVEELFDQIRKED